jgi:antitoxin component of MazEF toxin-antitoxin module
MLATLRKNGNSVVVTIPREELERVGVQVGDHVLVEIRPVELRPKLTPRLQAIAEEIVAQPGTAEAFARLADG